MSREEGERVKCANSLFIISLNIPGFMSLLPNRSIRGLFPSPVMEHQQWVVGLIRILWGYGGG